MTMKRLTLVLGILIFLSGAAFSQEAAGTPVFAPFVSRISAEVRNNLIRLSWTDSKDIRGPVYVYRSGTPFTGAPPAARPVEVPYGVQSYIDEAEPGTWYYFIAASDEGGRQYTVLIPFNNTVSVVLENSGPGIPQERFEEPAEILAGPGETGISSLRAALREDGVLISYQTPGIEKNAVLYRSVSPIRRTRDLLGAVIVQSGIVSPFVDYPVPGIPYYYAVILEDDLRAGRTAVFPGYNATVDPVQVPEGEYRIGLPQVREEIRSMPLPLITVTTAVPENTSPEIGGPTELSAEAARALSDLRGKTPKGPGAEKSPRAFDQDLERPAGGEEYTLRSIVQGPFRGRDWEASREALTRYLALPRSGAAEARARYYLGQAYYFSGKPREALFEFLSAQSHYPGEAAEWIQATLAKLTE
jgi:hypothetical protein